MTSYFDFYSKSRPNYQPADSDVVDFAPVEVTEGPAAEESHRIYLDRKQREDLEKALVLMP